MRHLHKIVLAACVAGCLYACRALTQGGSAAAGGLVGAAVAGPPGAAAGAAVGSLVSDRIADVLGADKQYTSEEYRALLTEAHKTIAELQGRKPIEVPKPFIPRWLWWTAAGLVLFRFRAALVPFFGSLFTGGFRAAGMTVLGVVLGGKMADKAKEATAMHVDARRRKKPSPLKNVVVEEKPHP